MKITVPSSTNGRKASCWVLLKRCTSSTNRMLRRPLAARSARASSMAARISFTPESTAEMLWKCAPVVSASMRASEVLPTPGGPHRIIECTTPERIALLSGLSGPSRCSWPKKSSGRRGRMRAASGT
jgi:hypothetical protein